MELGQSVGKAVSMEEVLLMGPLRQEHGKEMMGDAIDLTQVLQFDWSGKWLVLLSKAD